MDFSKFKSRVGGKQGQTSGAAKAQTEEREQAQNGGGQRNPFGGGGGGRFANLNLQPRRARKDYFPTDTHFECVQITSFGYTSFKGACVIEGKVLCCTQNPELEGRAFADVYAQGEWQDTFVARFAAAAWGLESDDPEIGAFGAQGAREAVGQLIDRDFAADPLYLRLDTSTGASKKTGNSVTNHFWNPVTEEVASVVAGE